jgi:hypothetical protein
MEAQMNFIVGALQKQQTLDLKREVQEASYARLQHRLKRTVWASGCDSWYRHPSGRIDTLWPGTTVGYWWRTRKFDAAAYSAL